MNYLLMNSKLSNKLGQSRTLQLVTQEKCLYSYVLYIFATPPPLINYKVIFVPPQYLLSYCLITESKLTLHRGERLAIFTSLNGLLFPILSSCRIFHQNNCINATHGCVVTFLSHFLSLSLYRPYAPIRKPSKVSLFHSLLSWLTSCTVHNKIIQSYIYG